MSDELPKGWRRAKLGELGQWTSGGTPSRSHPEYYGQGIPWVKTGDLDDGPIREVPESITPLGLANSSAKKLPAGTLLVAMYGATIGKLGILTHEAATNQACAALLPTGGTADVIPFVFHYLKSQREALRRIGQGGAQPNISQGILKDYEIPLPPIEDQRRIVERIEALQSRTRCAREALDAVPPLLEKLRQSILAAAFRGDLTKDWREAQRRAGKPVEPASKLLERIRAERRKKWEAAELAKMKAKGKAPADDKWKAKYKEPEPVDATGLPELPEGWCWAPLPSLGELSRGKSKHRPRNDPRLFGDDIPFIQTGDVARSDGLIREWTASYSALGVAQSRIFRRGTLCITIAANIAATGILDFDACFPDSVVGFVADGGSAATSYVELFIRTARANLKRFAPATAQANINLEVLSEIAVPVPPPDELDAIVQTSQQLISRTTACAHAWRAQVAQLRHLELALLARAFSGRL